MENYEEIKQEIHQLKKKLAHEKRDIENIEVLIKKKVDREAGIWEFTIGELEEEMWRRFLSLEKNVLDMSSGEITPRKKKINRVMVFFKKILRIIPALFSRLFLAKQNRLLQEQIRLNQELIPLHLAAILSLQKMKDRINVLEERAAKLIENQEELIDELKDLKSSVNKKER